ncbi:MAG: porin family protein [Bacteroidaceae bacterium]|nr:porin family protein [Bacteroidaceae bacterium]
MMKKVVLLACMVLMSTATFAQVEGLSVGINANYGYSSDYRSPGFGVKFQWEFIENFRAELSGNYYVSQKVKEDGIRMKGQNVWDANLNFHYLFPIGELRIYPMVGVTYMSVNLTDDLKELARLLEVDTRSGKVGFNAGGGIEFPLGDDFKLNVEAKYQWRKDADWFVLGVGCSYLF